MAVSTVNTFDNSTINVLGLRGYFRPTGGAGWIDLGLADDGWEITTESEQLDIQGARTGRQLTYESLPISFSVGYTFNSRNATDPYIKGLHVGATLLTDGDEGYSAPISNNPVNGELMWVRESAWAEKDAELYYHPRATLQGDGVSGTPGAEAAALNFTVTVLADDDFDIPAEINAAEPAAPYGFVYLVPMEDLDAAETAVSGITPPSS